MASAWQVVERHGEVRDVGPPEHAPSGGRQLEAVERRVRDLEVARRAHAPAGGMAVEHFQDAAVGEDEQRFSGEVAQKKIEETQATLVEQPQRFTALEIV